jgi:hypothetical protein
MREETTAKNWEESSSSDHGVKPGLSIPRSGFTILLYIYIECISNHVMAGPSLWRIETHDFSMTFGTRVVSAPSTHFFFSRKQRHPSPLGGPDFYVGLEREAKGPVLDIAYKTGRVLSAGSQAGVDADGIDLFQPMLDAARRNAAALG